MRRERSPAGEACRRLGRILLVALAGLVTANCSSYKFARVDPHYGVASSPRVVEEGEPVPKGGGYYRVGKPYAVAGREYVPETNPNYRAEGLASWYGGDFHGRLTANGEVFDKDAITAAHPTLPIPSYVRVTHLANRRSIIVRVNDRGPYAHDRIIDLSDKTAGLLGFRPHGVARVRVEYIGPAPLAGSDDRKLLATLRHDGRPAPAPSSVLVASAEPFVPAAARPLPGRRGVEIPGPPDRPFAVGRYAPPPGYREPRPPAMAAAAPEWERGARYGSATPLPGEPIAGYASAVVTGRGLY